MPFDTSLKVNEPRRLSVMRIIEGDARYDLETRVIHSIWVQTTAQPQKTLAQSIFKAAGRKADKSRVEYSGLDPVTPFDVGASASGNSTSANSGTVTTTSANELIFGAGITGGLFSAAGTGYTNRIITYDGDIAEDRIVTTAGSYSATATLSSSARGSCRSALSGAQLLDHRPRSSSELSRRAVSPVTEAQRFLTVGTGIRAKRAKERSHKEAAR